METAPEGIHAINHLSCGVIGRSDRSVLDLDRGPLHVRRKTLRDYRHPMVGLEFWGCGRSRRVPRDTRRMAQWAVRIRAIHRTRAMVLDMAVGRYSSKLPAARCQRSRTA
jgi:hypothetical protein